MNQQQQRFLSVVPRVPSVMDFLLFNSIPVLLGFFLVRLPNLLDLEAAQFALTFLFSLSLTVFLRAPELFELRLLLHEFDVALQQRLFPNEGLAADVRASVQHYVHLLSVIWVNWMLSMTFFFVLQHGILLDPRFEELNEVWRWLVLVASILYYVASILLYILALVLKGYLVRAVLILAGERAIRLEDNA